MCEIRVASLRDLPALRRLERACFPQDAWPLLDLVAVLSFPDVIRLKAVEGEEMIGFAAGDPRRSEGVGWIATIGVLPAHRRRGIGRRLLVEVERRLALPVIRLCVRSDNQPAIRMYEAAGYRRVDFWRGYYAGGGDALVMEKSLP